MLRIKSLLIPGVDKKLLVKDAARLMPDPARRRFLAGGASLGALTLLTGCDVVDGASADNAAGEDLEIQRRGAGGDLQSEHAGADL